MNLAESYVSVNYSLRPCKQVERRMILHTLQLLSETMFPISEYTYIGFGSIFFYDFIMLHKLLGLNNLVSVENDTSIEKRVHYNRPFAGIDMVIDDYSAVIPNISRDKKYLIWLDYDNRLLAEHLQQIIDTSFHLSVGSILLITIDIEPPKKQDDQTKVTGPADWMEYYKEQGGKLFNRGWSVKDFNQSKLIDRNFDLVYAAINEGLSPRDEVDLSPLFYIHYADGHRMLTIGGMVTGNSEARKLTAVDFSHLPHICRDYRDGPYPIRVPVLTTKERLLLDSKMPCADDYVPDEFEIRAEDIRAYREVYRYFPSYAEILI